MEPFVEKVDTRRGLTKPYVENGMVYASNGRIMVRRPLRKGEKVNGKGPESAKIIDSIPFDNTGKLDVAATYPKIVQALATTSKATKGGKESSSGIEVYRGKDGSIHFRSRDLEGNAYATDKWAKDSEFVGRVDGEYVKSVLELAAKSGAKEIEIAFNNGKDAKSPMSVHFRAGEWEGVFGGMRGDIKELDATEARNAHSRLVGMAGGKWEESLPKKDRDTYKSLHKKLYEAQYALDAASRADYWQGIRDTTANRSIVESKRSAAIEKARAALDAADKALADFEQAHGKQKFIDDWVKQAESPEPSAPSKGKAKKPASDIQPQKPLGEPEPKDVSEEIAEHDVKNGTQIAQITDFIDAIDKGDATRKAAHNHKQYILAKSNDFLKQQGIDGDRFTIKSGVINRHHAKNDAHSITPEEWLGISRALSEEKPLAITRYLGKNGTRENAYRIWTKATIGGRPAVVGIEVKSNGRNLFVNDVDTVFGADKFNPDMETRVYPKSEQEFQSVLDGLNSRKYPETPAAGDNVPNSAAPVKGVEINKSEKTSTKNPLGQVVPPEDGSVAQAIDAEIAADEAAAAKGKGKPQGAPPAPAPGSPARQSLDPGYEPESIGAGVKSPVARQQIVDKFKELFGGTVAIRGKNTTNIGKNYAGHYEPGAGIIRSKDPVSLRTIPHELGHHIDAASKRLALNRPATVKHELINLGRKLYGSKRPNGGYQSEGFAELIKYYLQGNEAGLQKEAPEAYKWLVNTFGKAQPDLYSRSPRKYPEAIKEWEYSESVFVRRVSENGNISWHDTPVFVGTGLKGKRIGLAEATSHPGCVNLIFRDFRIGRLNLATRTVESLRAYRLEGDPRAKGPQAG